MSEEIIYIDRDNTIDLILKSDGTAQDLSSVTRIDAIIGSTTISCTTSTAWPIKWSGLGTTGKVQLKLGDQDVTANTTYTMYLVLYDATNTNGVVWGTGVRVRMRDI